MNSTDIYNKLVNLGISPNVARILTATAKAESGLNATIPGDSGNSIGLFQIYMPAHGDKLTRLSGSDNRADWIKWLENPDNNIKAAAAVYNSQGLGAWTMYRNGGYMPYMNIYNQDVPVINAGAGTSAASIPGGTISEYKPSTWEKLKSSVMDKWYSILGTSRQAETFPTAAEQLDARKYWNEKYGTELPTEDLEKEIQMGKDNSLSGGLKQTAQDIKDTFTLKNVTGTITGGIFLLLVFIIGFIAFFKAFNVDPPSIGK